jgi:hypothetical protein
VATDSAVRTLLGLKDGSGRRQIIVWDTPDITIGRGPHSDIRVDEEDVSRDHAILYQQEPAFYVEDRATSNGTFVNREPIAQPRPLQTKDVVKVGSLELTFIRTSKDPAGLGLEVVFASQLKGGVPDALDGASAESTILSLSTPTAIAVDESEAEELLEEIEQIDAEDEIDDVDEVEEIEEISEFRAGGVANFDFDDEESGVLIESQEEDDSDPESVHEEVDALFGAMEQEEPEAATNTDANVSLVDAADTMAVTLELSGLTPELRERLRGLFGKTIELPALRICVKGDDLD